MTEETILQKFEDQKNSHLAYSVILDIVGMSSYLVPLLGGILDILYAPFYGIAIYSLYKVRLGKGRAAAGAMGGAIEEILPFTDIIPTACLMWVYTYKARRKETLARFVREFKTDRETVNAIMNEQPAQPRLPLFQRINNSFSNFFGLNQSQPKQIHYEEFESVELEEEVSSYDQKDLL